MSEKLFTVYVVDDDESICRALKRLLKASGYRALTFESAEDFINFQLEPGKGCLLLDIRLPGMSGLSLHEKLVSMGSRRPVIFMTAHDNPQWQESAVKAGAIAFLKKPFGEQALLDAVSRCRRIFEAGGSIDSH